MLCYVISYGVMILAVEAALPEQPRLLAVVLAARHVEADVDVRRATRDRQRRLMYIYIYIYIYTYV